MGLELVLAERRDDLDLPAVGVGDVYVAERVNRESSGMPEPTVDDGQRPRRRDLDDVALAHLRDVEVAPGILGEP